MKITELYKEFFESEKSGGIILIFCTLISIVISNMSFGNNYLSLWEVQIGGHSLIHWINDGLMAIFFLLIGLELKREINLGELSNIKNALLPIFAAVGGMLVPAAIYSAFNYGTSSQSGAGISMATDIAFSLGVLSLLGKRVPTSLKIFLTALAVIDDLGAIIVIALFYTKTILWTNLFISLAIFAILMILNRLKIKNLIPYLVGGIVMWYFMLHSGVHATISGVLLAFTIPCGCTSKKSSFNVLLHSLHKPVAFFILPLFALANTAILIDTNIGQSLTQDYSLGIAFGLIVGKPLGIFLMSYLAVALGFSKLSGDLNWKLILGTGFLAGIGFTMSIFITLLAFDNATVINESKLVILLSSLIAGVFGFVLLKMWLPEKPMDAEE
ncbi:MAG TPA: Na+/H+ antiporter NhaA [Paludibacter sp.]|nr:Na+/H+ antiporter NhaA [Paludibacter sp.]